VGIDIVIGLIPGTVPVGTTVVHNYVTGYNICMTHAITTRYSTPQIRKSQPHPFHNLNLILVERALPAPCIAEYRFTLLVYEPKQAHPPPSSRATCPQKRYWCCSLPSTSEDAYCISSCSEPDAGVNMAYSIVDMARCSIVDC